LVLLQLQHAMYTIPGLLLLEEGEQVGLHEQLVHGVEHLLQQVQL
jgi:hypothetical protein